MGSYRVLVIDDVVEARRVIRSGLESLDYDLEIVDVPSGEEAMLEFSRRSFDLLVVDIRLAGISGLELLEKLRRRDSSVKAIVITGLQDPAVRQQVASIKTEAFFVKPVKVSDFLNAVERSLGLSKSLQPELPLPGEPVEDVSLPELETGEQPITLAERLAGLRQELDALVALILDDRGQVVATTGGLPDWLAEPAMLTALVNAVTASLSVSYHMGIQVPRNVLSFPGMDFDLHLRPITPDLTLLVIVSTDLQDGTWRDILPQLQSASDDLQGILAEMGVSVKEPDLAPVELVESLETIEERIDTGELDQFFNQASETGMKPEEVDEFWESIIDQVHSEKVSNTGELSYEDARRLGLAPRDED